jgi:NADPH:quinone reductase-like Zn-dependent oxidoreductase
LRKADPFLARLFNGLLKPNKINILGFEFAGTVDAIGSNGTWFEVGDQDYASPDLSLELMPSTNALMKAVLWR